MDMHIPGALLQVAQPRRSYRTTDDPSEYRFCAQLCARYDAGVRALWIRWRPSPRPNFNPELLRSLDRCAEFIRNGDAETHDGPIPIEYTVLTSEVPRVFNFGGDLELFRSWIEIQDRAALVGYGTACIHVLYQNYVAHELPITTVSLVQGDCFGGGFEAALSSDILVAERQARFGFPEIMFNLFPGMGAYSFLDRRVGRRVTEDLLSSGRIYSADDMLAMGVIDKVVESGQGPGEIQGLIRRRDRNRNGLQGITSVRRRVNPVTFQELLDVVHLWADCALRLTSRDLKLMQRLASRQNDSAVSGRVH